MTLKTLSASEALSEGRKRFLHALFTTALEGGIGYWSECSDYHWSKPGSDFDSSGGLEDLDRFYAVIAPSGDDGCWGVFDGPADTAKLTINAWVMEHGARRFLRYCHGEIDRKGQAVPEDQQRPLPDDHYWRQWLVAEATHGAEGDYDADVADTIVQFGLFGEVVYA